MFCISSRFPVVMARSFSGGVVLRYVLPVLWMTSRLAVVGVTPKDGGCTMQSWPWTVWWYRGGVCCLSLLVIVLYFTTKFHLHCGQKQGRCFVWLPRLQWHIRIIGSVCYIATIRSWSWSLDKPQDSLIIITIIIIIHTFLSRHKVVTSEAVNVMNYEQVQTTFLLRCWILNRKTRMT